jgi:hypothetical protein
VTSARFIWSFFVFYASWLPMVPPPDRRRTPTSSRPSECWPRHVGNVVPIIFTLPAHPYRQVGITHSGPTCHYLTDPSRRADPGGGVWLLGAAEAMDLLIPLASLSGSWPGRTPPPHPTSLPEAGISYRTRSPRSSFPRFRSTHQPRGECRKFAPFFFSFGLQFESRSFLGWDSGCSQ